MEPTTNKCHARAKKQKESKKVVVQQDVGACFATRRGFDCSLLRTTNFDDSGHSSNKKDSSNDSIHHTTIYHSYVDTLLLWCPFAVCRDL